MENKNNKNTYRVYMTCWVEFKAESLDEVDEIVSDMDYSFSHDGMTFDSEIVEIQEAKKQKY
jgi:hypothetical protein